MSAEWTLKGIRRDAGSCDHCGRSLGRLFRVERADGEQMTVGVACSKRLTGYNWSVAQAERAQALAEREARAAEQWPELWEALTAQALREAHAYNGMGSHAASGRVELRDRGNVSFATEMLALSVARIG